MKVDVKWLIAVYWIPETHISVPIKGKEELHRMADDLLTSGGQFGLYVPESAPEFPSTRDRRGQIAAIARLLPMPSGRQMKDYTYSDLLQEGRWPLGWPCEVLHTVDSESAPKLRDLVDSAFAPGTFGGYVKRFQRGPLKLEPKLKPLIDASFGHLCT
jgi:hypothetical protein